VLQWPCEAHVSRSRSRSKIHKKWITCHVACHTFLIWHMC